MKDGKAGMRPGMTDKLKKKLKETISDEELERIHEVREYEVIKRGTMTEKIALYLDSLRQQLRQKKQIIEKRLWNVENINNNIARCMAQIETGQITEQIKDGITMNETELRTYVKEQQWLKRGEVQSIPGTLAEIRAIVGHHDVRKEVIMTEDEFDTYCESIGERLESLGHALFE